MTPSESSSSARAAGTAPSRPRSQSNSSPSTYRRHAQPASSYRLLPLIAGAKTTSVAVPARATASRTSPNTRTPRPASRARPHSRPSCHPRLRPPKQRCGLAHESGGHRRRRVNGATRRVEPDARTQRGLPGRAYRWPRPSSAPRCEALVLAVILVVGVRLLVFGVLWLLGLHQVEDGDCGLAQPRLSRSPSRSFVETCCPSSSNFPRRCIASLNDAMSARRSPAICCPTDNPEDAADTSGSGNVRLLLAASPLDTVSKTGGAVDFRALSWSDAETTSQAVRSTSWLLIRRIRSGASRSTLTCWYELGAADSPSSRRISALSGSWSSWTLSCQGQRPQAQLVALGGQAADHHVHVRAERDLAWRRRPSGATAEPTLRVVSAISAIPPTARVHRASRSPLQCRFNQCREVVGRESGDQPAAMTSLQSTPPLLQALRACLVADFFAERQGTSTTARAVRRSPWQSFGDRPSLISLARLWSAV